MAYIINRFKPKSNSSAENAAETNAWWHFFTQNLVVTISSVFIIVLILVFGALLYKHFHSTSKSASLTQGINAGLSSNGSKNKSVSNSSPSGKVVAEPPKLSKSEFAAIIASINSYNITGLKEHFASSVRIVDLFSGTNQTLSGNAANQELAILLNGASAPWVWGVPLSQLTNLENGQYSQYFNNNDIIGTSTNGYIISVQLNPGGQITGVFIAPTQSVIGSLTSSDTGAYHSASNDGNVAD